MFFLSFYIAYLDTGLTKVLILNDSLGDLTLQGQGRVMVTFLYYRYVKSIVFIFLIKKAQSIVVSWIGFSCRPKLKTFPWKSAD